MTIKIHGDTQMVFESFDGELREESPDVVLLHDNGWVEFHDQDGIVEFVPRSRVRNIETASPSEEDGGGA